MVFISIFIFLVICIRASSLYSGSYSSPFWTAVLKHTSPVPALATFIVALKINDADIQLMQKNLFEISDPSNEKYGKYFSVDDLKTNFGPPKNTVKLVEQFFESIDGSIVETNTNGDLLRITAEIKSIEKALQTELGLFTHISSSDVFAFKCLRPIQIPENVSSLISFLSLNSPILQPTVKMSRKHRIAVKAGVSSVTAITPYVITQLYDIPRGSPKRHGSTQALAEFYEEFYSNSDLTKFLDASGLPSYNVSLPTSNIYGDLTNDPNRPGGEANLDVQYIMGVAPGIPTYFYSLKDMNPFSSENEGFLTYLWIVGNQTNPPLVHSLSYGDVEAVVFDPTVPGAVEYGDRIELEFLKMGLRGITILYASGDNGANNFGTGSSCKQAWPGWPASSPYVTAVGGTQLSSKYLPICNQITCPGIDEIVCSGRTGGTITSGGGFSNHHSRKKAPWQEKAVKGYLAQTSKLPSASYFNLSGRAYPDISALSSNYLVVRGGNWEFESGTSASTPVFAAMVSLWNDLRLAKGLAPMGFINPFLYSTYETHPEAFNDITVGDIACGIGSGNCCKETFHAAAGWDAATGLGSPNFDKLAKLALLYGA